MPAPTSTSTRAAVAAPASRAILLALILAIVAMPATATVFISVEAASNAGGNGDHADNAANQNPPGGAIHGVAAATRDAAEAFVAEGASGPCDFFVGTGCGYELPQSRAVGEVRGDLGRIRGAVFASAEERAGVGLGVADLVLQLRDVLTTTTLGDLRFDLHFDVDVSTFGIPTTLHENSFAIRFSLLPLLANATETVFDFTTVPFEGGKTVVDRTFLFGALPSATQVLMTFDLTAHNECSIDTSTPAGASCSISTNAGNTAYIGVQGNYVSASGYSYPGFALAVPAPSTATLLVVAFFALGGVRRKWRGAATPLRAGAFTVAHGRGIRPTFPRGAHP